MLSRGAVKVLVEEGLEEARCSNELDLGTFEDVNMAACLDLLGWYSSYVCVGGGCIRVCVWIRLPILH